MNIFCIVACLLACKKHRATSFGILSITMIISIYPNPRSPYVYISDLTDAKKAEAQLAIAIGVPAGIIFLLIVIGILGLVCYLRQKRRDRALEKK